MKLRENLLAALHLTAGGERSNLGLQPARGRWAAVISMQAPAPAPASCTAAAKIPPPYLTIVTILLLLAAWSWSSHNRSAQVLGF